MMEIMVNVKKMLMFQSLKRDELVGFDGSGAGQVLDLETAVKDGVLDGIGGGDGVGAGVVEKLDLKKMIEDLNLSEVPSVFICPISLEPMQEPVTLCTGQTYERSNILKWFNLGHYICPTTMQELWDDSITPNTMLYHLIYIWFTQKYALMKKQSEDVQGRTSEILKNLKKVKGQGRVQALKELRQFVAAHGTVKKTVIEEGGISIISSLLCSYTSHDVGSEAIVILVNLELNSDSKKNLLQPEKFSVLVDILHEGSIATKTNCTLLIEKLMEDEDSHPEIVSSHRLLVGLMRLIKDMRHPNGVYTGLKLLRKICVHLEAKTLVVRIGFVRQLVEMLPSLGHDSVELVLVILESLSCVPEGGLALKECSETIPNMVKLIMRISESCTRHALSILSAVCKVAPDECSCVAVDEGLAAKLLLVIQSGCGPALKQQSAELLKFCSLNYTDTTFISKCKLSRTIQ